MPLAYYNSSSNTLIPKMELVKEVTPAHSDHWNKETKHMQKQQDALQKVASLMNLGQTIGETHSDL